jgi:hypothetical protein
VDSFKALSRNSLWKIQETHEYLQSKQPWPDLRYSAVNFLEEPRNVMKDLSQCNRSPSRDLKQGDLSGREVRCKPPTGPMPQHSSRYDTLNHRFSTMLYLLEGSM